MTVTASASGYVAGEETAVLAHLEGEPPLPRVTPPLPAHAGYKGRPTLVQNVETVAHMALIARHGPGWFREVGTAERPGTMLVTLSGAVRGRGVYEVPVGTTIDDVLARAGGPTEPLRALLVGGYFGGWVEATADVRLDDASSGAGVIVALGRSACPVAETARLTAWLANESAGQCGPCVHGLGALAGVLNRIAAGHAEREDFPRLTRWTDMVRRRGACAHPDGAARMLSSARRVFADELHDHAHHGPCTRCRA